MLVFQVFEKMEVVFGFSPEPRFIVKDPEGKEVEEVAILLPS